MAATRGLTACTPSRASSPGGPARGGATGPTFGRRCVLSTPRPARPVETRRRGCPGPTVRVGITTGGIGPAPKGPFVVGGVASSRQADRRGSMDAKGVVSAGATVVNAGAGGAPVRVAVAPFMRLPPRRPTAAVGPADKKEGPTRLAAWSRAAISTVLREEPKPAAYTRP